MTPTYLLCPPPALAAGRLTGTGRYSGSCISPYRYLNIYRTVEYEVVSVTPFGKLPSEPSGFEVAKEYKDGGKVAS